MIEQRTRLLTQLSIVQGDRCESWKFGRASEALTRALEAMHSGASRCAVATIESEEETTLADTLVQFAEIGQIVLNAPAWALCRPDHDVHVEDLGIVRVGVDGGHERLVAVRLSNGHLKSLPRLMVELLGREELLATLAARTEPHLHLWGQAGAGVQSVALGLLQSLHGGNTEDWRNMRMAQIEDLPTVQLAARLGLNLWLHRPSPELIASVSDFPCRLLTTSSTPFNSQAIEIPRLDDADLREIFRQRVAVAHGHELSEAELQILDRLLPQFEGNLGYLRAAVKALDVLSLTELEAMISRGVRIFPDDQT